MKKSVTKFYGILASGWANLGDDETLMSTPMLATVSDSGAAHIQPGDGLGIEHFSIFTEKEFNTSNYSIRSGDTGLDFTFEDELDPSSDYHRIKNYIDLLLDVYY